MVKVVGPESGTVAAPPESEFSLKLPSGEVMEHEATPLAFQKIEVRVPSETFSGTAQISTRGWTAGTTVCEVAAEVVATVAACCTAAAGGGGGGGGAPTW